MIHFVLIWIAVNCIIIITRNAFIFWTSEQRTPNTVHLPQTYVGWLCCSYIVDLALNSLFFADFYSLRARINCWEHDTLLKDLTTKNFSRSTIKEPTQPHSMLKSILSRHFLGSKIKLQKSSLKSCLSDCRSFRSRGCLEITKI